MIIAAHTEFPSDRHPMNRDRIDLVDAVQQRKCPIRGHFGGHSAREQLDQQRKRWGSRHESFGGGATKLSETTKTVLAGTNSSCFASDVG
jgi:hypothetical protein